MSTSTVTKKGQTTVPREVREALHIQPGSQLVWSKAGDGAYTVTVPDRRVTKLKGLVGKPKRKVSIEDMKRAIEGMGSDE